jgi:hypothetical protein
MVTICEACRTGLNPDDHVVRAAPQIDVTAKGSVELEYIDGEYSLFHVEHWPGDSIAWRERGRGPLASFP